MTLAALALLFILELKVDAEHEVPLMSARDARDMMANNFAGYAKAAIDPTSLAETLYQRQRRRLCDIRNSYAKLGLPVPAKWQME